MITLSQNLSPVSDAVLVITGTNPNPLALLDDLLERFVSNASSTGDVIDNFATELCRVFDKNGNKWFDLKGKDAKPVNEYRNKFVEKFEQVTKPDGTRKFSDAVINSYWHRVKVASGKVVQARVQGGILNVRAMTLSDLMTMINRVNTANADANNKYTDFDLVSDEMEILMDMFVRLGGMIDPQTKKLSSPF
jgi:hypothetical protein